MRKPDLHCGLRYLVAVLASILITSSSYADDKLDPTVGAGGFVEQIILPGTELIGKPIESDSPIVVRVTKVFRHGDSFRYDLQFHGLEPGKYDLSRWLVRKDGSNSDDLPEIAVEIKSLLPPGQIEPNPLEQGWLPRLGGYRIVATLAAVLWFAVLLGLIFLRRSKNEQSEETIESLSLADLLKPRLENAVENKMSPTQYAELERMLFAFWRQRLNLESVAPETALAKIHADSDAGPLMKQLEQWMHNPSTERAADLSDLLKPYQKMSAVNSGFDV